MALYEDPANAVINTAMAALRAAITPNSEQPPVGGGTETVRLFAGDGLPIEVWDFHRDEGCEEPFAWVRLVRRYRSRDFPSPYTGDDPCGSPVVIVVEVGIARCAAVTTENCDWDCYLSEAEVSADDSWRIELALCSTAKQLRAKMYALAVGLDSVIPYGPEGGVIAWSGALYAQL